MAWGLVRIGMTASSVAGDAAGLGELRSSAPPMMRGALMMHHPPKCALFHATSSWLWLLGFMIAPTCSSPGHAYDADDNADDVIRNCALLVSVLATNERDTERARGRGAPMVVVSQTLMRERRWHHPPRSSRGNTEIQLNRVLPFLPSTLAY